MDKNKKMSCEENRRSPKDMKISRPMVTRDIYSHIPLNVEQMDEIISGLIIVLVVLLISGIICGNFL